MILYDYQDVQNQKYDNLVLNLQNKILNFLINSILSSIESNNDFTLLDFCEKNHFLEQNIIKYTLFSFLQIKYFIFQVNFIRNILILAF